MTNTSKRKPGRPAGSTRYRENDRLMLTRVADMVAADPTIRPTTALRQLDVDDDTSLHRLRRKWKADGTYLIEARARRREQARVRSERMVDEAVGRVGSFLRNIDPAALERAHETSLAVNRTMVEAGLRVARWVDENPETVQRMRDAVVALDGFNNRINAKIAGVMRKDPDLFRG